MNRGQEAGGRRGKPGGCEAGVLSGWEPGEKQKILVFFVIKILSKTRTQNI